MPKLSVTVITRNEAHRIAAALESVAWADERIVVDSGSTDDTVAIARRLAHRVETRAWEGYAAQKNYAASIASHDWIFSLDADERVGVALGDEIRELLKGEPAARGYRVPRVTNYLGQWIRSTDWWPDWQLRLYDRRVRLRRHPDAPPSDYRQLLFLSAIAIITHPTLDFMNSYGMRWLMPFVDKWFYADGLFIIDLWLLIALGAGVFFARRTRRSRPYR